MKKLTYEGCWPVTLYGWDGSLVTVEDASGCFSRHSGFVQAVKRVLGPSYKVWSRKKTCFAMTLPCQK